jgi:hypothetical protein
LGAQGNSYLERGEWQVSVAHRWLHSDRHFVGEREQPQRKERGDEVINDVHTIDMTAMYAITPRVSLSFTLPFVFADRSSLYEHDRRRRFHTSANGLGDVRLVGTVWLLDPPKHPDGNIALGLGVKAPTGDYEAMDTFYRPAPTIRPVDNSIQPGDGGWGFLVEAQAFQKLIERTYAYMNATYLFNPRERIPSTGNSVWA